MNPAQTSFAALADLVHQHAKGAPRRVALVEAERELDYAGLATMMDRVACGLQRANVGPGCTVAICATASIEYAAVFLGVLQAGAAVAPLATGTTAAALHAMLKDCDPSLLFLDEAAAAVLDGPVLGAATRGVAPALVRISLGGSAAGFALQAWLDEPAGGSARAPEPVQIAPQAPFNIIYSSGTTGVPKGIVQSHAMRWAHVQRGASYGYSPQTVTLLSTPLYSNTTLVVFVPTLAFGGTVVLMPKFDAARYLALAERHRVTHTMLVPVQYQRLLAHSEFGRHDLRSFQVKFATSAPFAAALKAEVLDRWPGQLIEFYGMTEGGGTCILEAHAHRDKLHTVGRPAEGHDIRLIDESGAEAAAGAAGEVVGHSPGMMTGYYHQPEKTRETEWFDPSGKRFIRSGDIGRFDAQGFLTLIDRRKDLIISGGFNVYPGDLEAVLREHPGVADVAVVGVPSERWGETPVAFVVPRAGPGQRDSRPTPGELLLWSNSRLAKLQRLHSIEFIAELPRSAIGKVLKRELRQRFQARA